MSLISCFVLMRWTMMMRTDAKILSRNRLACSTRDRSLAWKLCKAQRPQTTFFEAGDSSQNATSSSCSSGQTVLLKPSTVLLTQLHFRSDCLKHFLALLRRYRPRPLVVNRLQDGRSSPIRHVVPHPQRRHGDSEGYVRCLFRAKSGPGPLEPRNR